MSKSIRISEKHGVNPSLGICFFCNKENGEVILPGRMPGDEEAPRHAVWHMQPCKECAGYMEQGIILISVRNGSDRENPYRSGAWIVMKEEALERMFTEEAACDIKAKRMAFIEDDVWDQLGLPRGAIEGND